MNKSKVGFFGGCFNPPTNVHINLAKKLIEDGILDKVIFVPVGDYYEKIDLVSAQDRYNMLKIVCRDYENIDVNDIACSHKDKLFAIDTLKLIYDKYNKMYDVYFIMGADNFERMPLWKDYKELISKYKFVVIERLKHKEVESSANIIVYKNTSLVQDSRMSSTQIRKMIRTGQDVKEYINKNVLSYIEKHKLYLGND